MERIETRDGDVRIDVGENWGQAFFSVDVETSNGEWTTYDFYFTPAQWAKLVKAMSALEVGEAYQEALTGVLPWPGGE